MKLFKRKVLLWDADHPARQKAIQILEDVAEYMGDEDMFDCVEGTKHEVRWYELEDMITNVIAGVN